MTRRRRRRSGDERYASQSGAHSLALDDPRDVQMRYGYLVPHGRPGGYGFGCSYVVSDSADAAGAHHLAAPGNSGSSLDQGVVKRQGVANEVEREAERGTRGLFRCALAYQ